MQTWPVLFLSICGFRKHQKFASNGKKNTGLHYWYNSALTRNKYLVFDSSDENKEVLKKYKELWDGIKNKIENINDGEWKYGKDFTKIRFDTDDDLPVNKLLNLHMLAIIVRSAFEDKGKFYQVYSDELMNWMNWIELIFQKELMLIKKMWDLSLLVF